MGKMPDYLGVTAFGVKMGVIAPGCDLSGMVYDALERCHQDGLLEDGDTVCVTESVVARAQNNYVILPDIVKDVQAKLQLKQDASIGVLFPILSRNRFSLILKGIAAAVPDGKVVVQLSHPTDEVGNQLLPLEVAESLAAQKQGIIRPEDLQEEYVHPITGVNYLQLYQDIISDTGAQGKIVICNDPLHILNYDLDGIVVSNVHERQRCREKLESRGARCITLQDICNDPHAGSWSEWGLLGSNLSTPNKLKLAPRDADDFANHIQKRVAENLGVNIEAIVYGDGAYCDPSTGIYELADPQPAFGTTPGLRNRYREGLKYKYLVDKMLEEGMDLASVEETVEKKIASASASNGIETEGTTPRKVEDLLSSLADLVSGSADEGTPLIVVKGFL